MFLREFFQMVPTNFFMVMLLILQGFIEITANRSPLQHGKKA
jgi:hypothetical protein